MLQEEKRKLLWRCRRGMLELDLILEPFVQNKIESLSEELQQRFVNLLKLDDPVLFGWLMGHEQVDQPEYIELVSIIRSNIHV